METGATWNFKHNLSIIGTIVRTHHSMAQMQVQKNPERTLGSLMLDHITHIKFLYITGEYKTSVLLCGGRKLSY